MRSRRGLPPSMLISPACGTAEQAADQRGLAGAVGADQRDALAQLDAEVDAIEHTVALEELGDAFENGSWWIFSQIHAGYNGHPVRSEHLAQTLHVELQCARGTDIDAQAATGAIRTDRHMRMFRPAL